MNRREFLKVLRDASVAVPALAVVGKTAATSEQVQPVEPAKNATEHESVSLFSHRVADAPFLCGSAIYIGTAWPYDEIIGEKTLDFLRSGKWK